MKQVGGEAVKLNWSHLMVRTLIKMCSWKCTYRRGEKVASTGNRAAGQSQ